MTRPPATLTKALLLHMLLLRLLLSARARQTRRAQAVADHFQRLQAMKIPTVYQPRHLAAEAPRDHIDAVVDAAARPAGDRPDRGEAP